MKKTLVSASLLLLGMSSTHAQVAVDIEVNRLFELTTPTTSRYIEGETEISISDGSFSLGACAFHPSLTIVQPNIFCPLGTTAFIQAGDIDGDGISDLRAYWSVASVTRAIIIDPFNPSNITLAAAPPSSLPRPRSDFLDFSIAMFYDIINPPVFLYDIAAYRSTTSYGLDEYKRHADEWVPGIYIYSVPVVDRTFENPGQKTALKLQVTTFVEPNGYRKGLVGFGLDTKQWANGLLGGVLTGALEMDPRVVTNLKWKGNNRSNIIATDILEFGIEDDVGDLIYPTFDVLYQLANPYTTQFSILPYAFSKGDTGTAIMRFSRDVNTSTIATDSSIHEWNWPMRFIDSFKGHVQFEHRFVLEPEVLGVKVKGKFSSLTTPTADYDGDKLTNIFEFAFSKDDGDDISTTLEYSAYNDLVPPTALLLAANGLTAPIPGNAPIFTDVTAPLAIPYTIDKRLNVGSSITYGYEISYNATAVKPTWKKLKAPVPGTSIIVKDSKAGGLVGNPNFTWTITDTFDDAGVPGTTTIQGTNALPVTVRIRSTAAVTSGY